MTTIDPPSAAAGVEDDPDRPDPAGGSPWWMRRPGLMIAVAAVTVAAPLLVAVVALRGDPWYPVLDLAMTEFRVRDVGSANTPLIGLPGRIGDYPDQGSHPGPLSFLLLAPMYRALGSSSWALEAGTVIIHVAAISTALWIGNRRGGWRGVALVALLLAVVVRGYGQVALTQPWNPYLPLVAWVVVLLAAWSVLCRDHAMLMPLVIAGTFCAQTHVPYLLVCVGLATLAFGTVMARAWRGQRDERRAPLRSAAMAAGIGVLLWLPPVADQLGNDPGNIRRLLDHFGSPPERALGVADGVELALRHLDVWAGIGGQLAGTGRFISAASASRGAVVLVCWAVAAVVVWRAGPRADRPAASPLRALHVVVGVSLVLGTFSMVRIFGRPWFYLTLWAWAVTALAIGAVGWTVLDRWSARRTTGASASIGHRLAVAAATVAVVASVATAIAFVDARHPEERLSEAVGALAGPTYDAVAAGTGVATGTDGRYLVRWSDAADIGSPGFGLLNELERRGLDVAADAYFHVPVTDHRVRPRAGNDAQIHLATGGYIAAWKAEPEATLVARFDPRTEEQRAEYGVVRRRLIERLAAEGLGDLAPGIDTNLFGTTLDPRLSADDQADLAVLLELGQPMAVFIAPAPADGDPTAL